MGKPYSTVYPIDDVFDIIACTSFHGIYHICAFKDEVYKNLIHPGPLMVGSEVFMRGRKYTKIGKSEKTASGFVHYDGAEIEYVGNYKDNALFIDENGPMVFDEYPLCFWSWKYFTEHSMFVAITAQHASRRMEL